MKKLSTIIIALLLTVSAFAITIKDIQYTTDASGDSPLKNQVVTVSGIVTGEPYAFGGSKMYIQDAQEAWSGISVNLGVHINELVGQNVIISEGDSVTISGKVEEIDGLTEITTVTSVVLEKEGVGCFAPMVITSGISNKEQYEGCLVRVLDVNITNGNAGNGEWEVNDGSGVIRIGDEGNAPYYFYPEKYDDCISLTGILSYSDNKFKIVPRLAWDIVEGTKTGEVKVFTRIQRIQHVRYSDLLKVPDDYQSDKSYFYGIDTTINVKGVVTMPTNISYAGDGVKFILADVDGGPWSSVLSYSADASIFPDLFAGDVIEMSGYVDEYTKGNSNMTEFFLTGDIEIVDELDLPDLPDTSVIKTADLRHPVTAEQWGNNFVKIENAKILANDVENYIFQVDDGSGSCLVGYDSDSLAARAGKDYFRAPIGTVIESITGWIYHHYGNYSDSTTYNINPLYEWDIVLGEGPVMLLKPTRNPVNIPKSTQDVIVSVKAFTTRGIDTAKVYYRVDNGVFTDVDLIDVGNDIWSGAIPSQVSGSIVEYYFYVVDDSSDVSALPSKHATGSLFTYKVLDTDPTVYDIQYTHAESGLSPLHGCDVSFNAYLTMKGTLASNFKDNAGKGAISVASAPGVWNGVWVLADTSVLAILHEGDYVKVTGIVDDDHEAYSKWQKNTYVVGSVELLLNEGPLGATPVSLADLEADPESFEGVLVEITDDGGISAINEHDFTLSDNISSFLVDDDFVADSILDIIYMENVVVGGTDTLVVGDSLSYIKGVVIYSYGSIKIEVRNLDDITVKPRVIKPGIASVPDHFVLHQNYPNPFNPVTTIRFDLAKATDVKLTIYDLGGRRIQELINSSMNAGVYDIPWNAAHLSSGMYLYRLETPEFIATNKMVLLK